MLTLFKFILTLGCFFAVQYALHANPAGLMREIDPIDNPDILSPRAPLERNLTRLSADAPKRVALPIRPWANGGWKHDSGLIAARYADSAFLALPTFRQRSDYFKTYSLNRILQQNDTYVRDQWMDILSPAEKYDLLVGDTDATFSQSLWAEGEKLLKNGTLAHWMGICEGSAAASVLFPEPQHGVTVTSANGAVLQFHVLDIKGLAGMLWSAYNAKIPIAGSRCAAGAMKKDINGVVINEGCFNNNPGSFHIAAMNYLGLRRAPFFVNRETHSQVWNSPVVGYDYRFFNVRNGLMVKDLESALVPLASYTADPYRRYRSASAQSVVGVEMVVKLAKGATTVRDTPAAALIGELKYLYDLELDAQGVIVGGEWRTDNHPDFMWAVEPGFTPRSIGDLLLGNEEWNGRERISPSWLSAVRQSSARNQPLYLVVKKLVELSTQ